MLSEAEEKAWQDHFDKLRPREAHLRKFALALLQQCKDENLTMSELGLVMNSMKHFADRTTLRDGLTL